MERAAGKGQGVGNSSLLSLSQPLWRLSGLWGLLPTVPQPGPLLCPHCCVPKEPGPAEPGPAEPGPAEPSSLLLALPIFVAPVPRATGGGWILSPPCASPWVSPVPGAQGTKLWGWVPVVVPWLLLLSKAHRATAQVPQPSLGGATNSSGLRLRYSQNTGIFCT